MSKQESLTEMFKKMSDMIEGLVEENEKIKNHNERLIKQNEYCKHLVKGRKELNEFGKIWSEEIIGKMIHPLYFSSSNPVYTPHEIVGGLMCKIDKLEEQMDNVIKKWLREKNEKNELKEKLGEHYWSSEKQDIINDFMERGDGWSDYHNFIEEYYPEEFKREQALLSALHSRHSSVSK